MTWRLKDTSLRHDDGTFQLLSAAHVFKDYQFSTDNQVQLPAPEAATA
jgi:nitronate monooxygenase